MNPNWEDINFVLLPYHLKPQNYLDDTSFLKKILLLRVGTHFCYFLPGPVICLETILLYSKKALLWNSFQLGDPLDLDTRL